MSGRRSRLSFRAMFLIGIGALLLILLLVIALSYNRAQATIVLLEHLVGEEKAAHETLLTINDLIASADRAFTIYVRRDRVTDVEVGSALELLERGLATVESAASAQGISLEKLSPLAHRSQMAFAAYVDEDRLDAAADAATAYLRRARELLGEIRHGLVQWSSRGVEGAMTSPDSVARLSALLNVAEAELQRFASRERVSLEEIMVPVEHTIALLRARMTSDSITPAHLERLLRVLKRYRIALHSYGEDERVVGNAEPSTEFTDLVLASWANAALALTEANRAFAERIAASERQLALESRQGQRALLGLAASGALLAVLVSIVLSRMLSTRLRQLLVGTERISQGEFKHRLHVAGRDELGELGHAFDEMAAALEAKDMELRVRLSDLDEAHRELRSTNETLETRVRMRTVELEQALAVAEDASRAKNDFLAKVSHEIRTPMTGLLAMAELLAGTGLDARQLRYVRAVHDCGETLLRVMNDILDLDRLQSVRVQLDDTEFELASLVSSTIDLVSGPVRSKGLELAYYLPRELPGSLRGDPHRLRQILLNLLNNALKFTERGEIVLEVELGTHSGRCVELRFLVTDTGVGVADSPGARIFEPFSQADDSATREFGGVGLGLTIAKELVQLMGGRIGFESDVGVGSRFWFQVELTCLETPTESPALDREHARHRLLLAGHARLARNAHARMLRDWGHSVDVTDDWRGALSSVSTGAVEGYDALIVDPGPAESAASSAIALIDEHVAWATPTIVVGEVSDSATRRPSASSDWVNCVAKPVHPWILRVAIDRVLGLEMVDSLDQPLAQAGAIRPFAPGLRVLLAEDNPVCREGVSLMLREKGFRVSVAEDGLAALELLESETFDIAFIDCQMPRMDGYELAVEFRRREGSRRRTSLVALTASAMESDRRRCLEAGMDDYVAKPVDTRTLVAVIDRWCPRVAIAPEGEPARSAPELSERAWSD